MVYVENELMGKRLKKVRETADKDYYDMAKLFGISVGHYRKIERGVYGLDVQKLMILYEKLGVDPLYLLGGRQEMKALDGNESRVNATEQVCEILAYCQKKIRESVEV